MINHMATLWCDNACGAWVTGDTGMLARKEGRMVGWHVWNGLDLCPQCWALRESLDSNALRRALA